jgi:cardiolipin synthase
MAKKKRDGGGRKGKGEQPARRLLKRFLRQAREQAVRERSSLRRFRLFVWRGWLRVLAWMADADWKKLLGLFLLGLFSVIAAFLLPQQKSPSYGLAHEVAVESPDFIPTIAGATGAPSTNGNKVELFINGARFYPAMLEAIRAARRSVTLEMYMFKDGEVARQFADAMTAKAREGVEVRLLLDSVGSSGDNEKVIRVLEEAGCKVGWYHPIKLLLLNRFDNRTHRELLIIDGRVGFTGGAGVADHWIGDAERPGRWRDTHVRIEGPAVVTLQTGFSLKWLETTGEVVSGPAYFPAPEPAGPHSIQTVLSEPETRSSPARLLYFLSIMSARKSILIANPYFVPDDRAIQLLIDAKRRGVDVKIMVPGEHTDHQIVRRNSSRLWGPLLEAGVEIYEYNRTMMHHKYMVCDGVFTTIGTINFDNLSFALNDEVNVCLYDRSLAAQFEEMYRKDLEGCDPVTLEEWHDRGLGVRVTEALVSILRRIV